MKQKEHILIIGAGLCGSLLALRLGQRAQSACNGIPPRPSKSGPQRDGR